MEVEDLYNKNKVLIRIRESSIKTWKDTLGHPEGELLYLKCPLNSNQCIDRMQFWWEILVWYRRQNGKSEEPDLCQCGKQSGVKSLCALQRM